MTYIKRHGERTIRELAASFGAVMVTGARQAGKTTLFKALILKMGKSGVSYASLDNAAVYKAAVEEGPVFFEYNKPPAFIDEIQCAPNLFSEIKQIIDARQEPGLFYLSGSRQFNLMDAPGESLAGRLGILNLTGLSLREISGIKNSTPFLPVSEYFEGRKKSLPEASPNAIWQIIHRGAMPMLYAKPTVSWSRFYGAYVRTYIERDVRDLAQVGDDLKFLNFMTSIAARTGKLLNLSESACDAGVSNKTAERWLSILQASNLIYLLRPYGDVVKRAIKTPKLYFMDTGLAAYLTKWTSAEVLRDGAAAGEFFETFVITEILKSYLNRGDLDPPLYFYRDKDGKEIDLLILRDGRLFPIEIKKTSNPGKTDIKTFSVLDNLPNVKRGPGGIICLCGSLLPLKGEDAAIPVNYV
jgi:predicted AAA+ superfamily ATPase